MMRPHSLAALLLFSLDSLTALTAALNQHLALKFSHEIRYRHEPIDGNDDTDTTTKASLV